MIGIISDNYATCQSALTSIFFAGNSAPKEKESSKREKLKDRENEHVFVQQSSTAVHRSPRSLGELQIRFDFNFSEAEVRRALTQYLRCESKGWRREGIIIQPNFPPNFNSSLPKSMQKRRGKSSGIEFTKRGRKRENGGWKSGISRTLLLCSTFETNKQEINS